MAPKKQGAMKRPAAAPEERASKRAAVTKESGKKGQAQASSKQFGLVSKALLQSTDFPAHVLEMLSTSLPGCLGMPKEQRHPFQQEIAGMVGEVLAKCEAGLQGGVQSAETSLAAVKALKDTDEATERDEAEKLSAKEEAWAAAQTAADEASKALSAAREAQAATEAAKAAGDAEHEAAAEKKARLSSALSDHFLPIKEGGAEPAKVKEGIAAVLAAGGDFSFDATLLKALPSAAQKAFGDRGSFDSLVLDQIEAEFKKHAEALDELIANAEPTKKEQEAKVEEATAESEKAKAHEQECAAALVAAKAEVKEALASKRAAAKAIRERGPEIKQMTAELEKASTRLDEFRSGPLAAFQELRDLSEAAPAEAEEAQAPKDPSEAPADDGQTIPTAEAVAKEAEANMAEAKDVAMAVSGAEKMAPVPGLAGA